MFRQREPNRRAVWTEARLKTCLSASSRGERIVVLANREPFSHDRAADGRIVARRSASGLVTALEPLVQACSGVWVAHGAGTADQRRCRSAERPGRATRQSSVPAPAGVARRAASSKATTTDLRMKRSGRCATGRTFNPCFGPTTSTPIASVNARFADAVREEAKGKSPLVLVQDYHFALAPQMIHERLPLSTIVAFWHIPWPNPRDFEICPWAPQLLKGLLGSSIVGFQTPSDCRNFIDTVESSLEAHIDREQRRHHVCGPPDDGPRLSGFSRVAEPVGVPVGGDRGLPTRCPPPASTWNRTSVWVSASIEWTTPRGSRRSFWRSSGSSNCGRSSSAASHSCSLRNRAGNALPAYRDLRLRLLTTAERINARFGCRHLPSHHPARGAPRARGGLPISAGCRSLLRRQPP